MFGRPLQLHQRAFIIGIGLGMMNASQDKNSSSNRLSISIIIPIMGLYTAARFGNTSSAVSTMVGMMLGYFITSLSLRYAADTNDFKISKYLK